MFDGLIDGCLARLHFIGKALAKRADKLRPYVRCIGVLFDAQTDSSKFSEIDAAVAVSVPGRQEPMDPGGRHSLGLEMSDQL